MSVQVHLYRHFDASGLLLYVGISLSVFKRLAQHRQVSPWFDLITKVTIETYTSREEALVAERKAVEQESPKFNKVYKLSELPKPMVNQHAEKSRQRLLDNVVGFQPIYKLSQAANTLEISAEKLKTLLESGKVGSVYQGSRRFITGWQMIEYLEFLAFEAEKEQAA